ncbi:chymotrypsin-1 [Culex quinquefasciatus]|uniref:Chymotrypsin-1 n=1 Tax=Culex quinquefasciatus TaxID=7176 RepID=B0X818_CULQU|nr:chymotrypsin-1 [Culex quinquefasciatus]|eukprot:XP_001865790.1 chymotrypsin-1 [Culex quinquefasciatus]
MSKVVVALAFLLIYTDLGACKNVPHIEANLGAVAGAKCQDFPLVAGGSDQVFKGKAASIVNFPYMAALGSKALDNEEIKFHCGASLISFEFLLTAAHCVTIDVKTTFARFGVEKLCNFANDKPVDIVIQKCIVHPASTINDIALVQLERSIYEDYIHPICLYTNPEDPTPDIDLTIAGWGQIDPNHDPVTPAVLRMGQMNVWPLENCTEKIKELRPRHHRDIQRLEGKMCALKTNSTGHTLVDSCFGDSGGPLALEKNGRRYLVGVISTGFECGTSGQPGFYTRVSSYINWIEENVWPEDKRGFETDSPEN